MILVLPYLLSASPVFPVWPTVLAIAFLGGIVLLAEALSRILISDPEFTRKVVHIGAGNVILLAWHFNLPAWIGISAAAIAAAIALLSYFVPILPSINSVGRQSLGTFFYAVSIGVLISWFFPQQPQYAAIGILTMSWGDGMAALVGQNWGRHRYRIFGSTKSWEGSLTMAIVSYAICCLILLAVEGNLWSSWFIPLVVAVLAAGCEAISKLGIDNLTVPIASGGIPFLLIQLFVAH